MEEKSGKDDKKVSLEDTLGNFNQGRVYKENYLLDKRYLSSIYKYNDFITKKNLFSKLDKTYIKDICNRINKYNSIISLPKVSFNNYNINISSYTNESVTADNLGEFVLPLVEYIQATKPDYIVACDRGGRLIGTAVSMLHKRLHGRLPTVDGTLRFKRISKGNSERENREHLIPLAREMLAHRENPRVLVLDDRINSGKTREIIDSILGDLGQGKINVKYGVIAGGKADAPTKDKWYGLEWSDNPALIGVDYNGISPRVVSSDHHLEYRKKIKRNINQLVEDINKGVKRKKISTTQEKRSRSRLLSTQFNS